MTLAPGMQPFHLSSFYKCFQKSSIFLQIWSQNALVSLKYPPIGLLKKLEEDTSLSKRKCYVFHRKKTFLHHWQHGNIVIPVGIDPAPAWPSLFLYFCESKYITTQDITIYNNLFQMDLLKQTNIVELLRWPLCSK